MGLAHAEGTALMGLWQRIKRVALTDVSVLVKGLDTDTVQAVERVLVEADFGPAAFAITAALEDRMRLGLVKTEAALREWLRAQLVARMGNGAVPLRFAESGPTVILMLGVNGAGKTTQTAKLAHRLQREGRSVVLAAADTYRAGAAEQLAVWGERLGVPCVTGTARGDPAAVAYDAIERAVARQADVVLVDTAGRLHTHGDLMDELKKIARVIAKRLPGAPHESLLVLDGTVGQNAIHQGRAFTAAVPVTGVIITKLDGTAKGGAALAIPAELGVPIRFLGTGEGLEDLEPFDPERFADRVLAE